MTGCDSAPQADYSKVELVAAHGTVTLDGKPLPGAVVTFEADDGQMSYGLTDRAGRYALQFDSLKKGVTPGTKTVRISTARRIVGLNAEEDGDPVASEAEPGDEAAREHAKELVPVRYNKSSELSVDVTASQDEYNFQLAVD